LKKPEQREKRDSKRVKKERRKQNGEILRKENEEKKDRKIGDTEQKTETERQKDENRDKKINLDRRINISEKSNCDHSKKSNYRSSHCVKAVFLREFVVKRSRIFKMKELQLPSLDSQIF
jgi:hypothetical protein